MKKMIIIWIILAISLVGTLTFIGLKFEDSVKEYRILENDLIEAADMYINLEDISLNKGESIKIKTKDLIKHKYLNSTKVKDDECTGFVLVKKGVNKFKYNAYIKCSNYTTLDYEKMNNK